MFKKGKQSEIQFEYWNLRRKGHSQSEIARKFNITRQSISKSVKVIERDVAIRLLESAQMSGILPQYYDEVMGILIGTIPPLGNIKCILIIDNQNNSKLFYDPSSNPDMRSRDEFIEDLKETLNSITGTNSFKKLSFEDCIDLIISKKRGDK
jgi:hypothetical protein